MIPAELTHRPSADEINALPLRLYEGPIHIIRSPQEWDEAFDDLNAESILGFDTETQPSFRKGVVNDPSLIQLATASAVYLIQLEWWAFDARCAAFLGQPEKIKAGVSIRDDMQSLARLSRFTPSGLADLGDIARARGLPNHGLRTLAASMFGWRISKGAQCSNWGALYLTPKQIKYAATDAWVSRELYIRMRELGLING